MSFHWQSILLLVLSNGLATAQVARNGVAEELRSVGISVKEFGCAGNGQHDDTACFVAARHYLETHIRADTTPNSDGNRLGAGRLLVPAGTYLVTQPEVFMSDSFTVRTYGYRLEGEGAGLSVIDYRPTVPGPLFANRDAFIDVHIDNITFACNDKGADFLDSYSAGGAQSYHFSDVNWKGRWRSLFSLTGTNGNSEWDWGHVSFAVETTNIISIPEGNTSDQFLNFWFHQSRFDVSRGGVIDARRGGHFKITDCDFSGLNGSGDPKNPDVLFKLGGNNHASGVTYFECTNSRFELKTNSVTVLYSEWGGIGQVTFADDDFSSQAVAFEPRTEFDINMNHAAGAARYNFVRCHLMGRVLIDYSNNDWGYARRVSFEDVQFLSYDDYSAAIGFVQSGPAGSNSGALPTVECTRCTGRNDNIYLRAKWMPRAAYSKGASVYSNGYLYEALGAGSSGATAPHGRTERFADGSVVWRTIDRYSGSDYVQNGQIRALGLPSAAQSGVLKVASISDPNNWNCLPHRIDANTAGFGRLILPPFATVLKIQIFIEPQAEVLDPSATFVARTDGTVARVFGTRRVSPPRSGDSFDFPLAQPYNVGGEIGSRTIILEAGPDVSRPLRGWFLVYYM